MLSLARVFPAGSLLVLKFVRADQKLTGGVIRLAKKFGFTDYSFLSLVDFTRFKGIIFC